MYLSSRTFHYIYSKKAGRLRLPKPPSSDFSLSQDSSFLLPQPTLNGSASFLSFEMYSEGPLDEIFIDQGKEAVEICQQTSLKESAGEWLERKYR